VPVAPPVACDPVVLVLVEAAVVGWNVATNGVWSGVGSTTGTVPMVNETVGVPNWTAVGPVAWITWTVPAWSDPAHSVDLEATVVAWTQQGPVAVTVIVKELLPTGKAADDPVDDEATIWLGTVVGVTLVLPLLAWPPPAPWFAEPAVVDVDAGLVARVVDEAVGWTDGLERLLPMYASAPKNTSPTATSITAVLRRGR